MHINQNLCRINFGTEEVILVKEIENHSEKNLPNDKIDISLIKIWRMRRKGFK